ncbi:hypothetical protein Tco_0573148, partial [Tanacetum coccineum]
KRTRCGAAVVAVMRGWWRRGVGCTAERRTAAVGGDGDEVAMKGMAWRGWRWWMIVVVRRLWWQRKVVVLGVVTTVMMEL